MLLKEILVREKSSLVSGWIDYMIDSYPSDSENFLRNQLNQFSNPVGHTIRMEIESLFRFLLDDSNNAQVKISLDEIIRMRAVQDFKPSQAVGFVFALKSIIRDKLKNAIEEHKLHDQLVELNGRIDEIALLAFDVYIECREDLLKVRWGELKRRYAKLLEHTGIFIDNPLPDVDDKQTK